jgi:dipeptide/tripeptide permease
VEDGDDGVAATAQETLANYVDVYSTMGYVTVGIGLVLVVFSGLLNRLMHGIR